MEFAEPARNDLWIARCARWIAVLGMLIILGGAGYGAVVVGEAVLTRVMGGDDWMDVWTLCMRVVGMVSTWVVGVLTIAIAKLLMYMIGPGSNPGWFLRNASKGLLLLAGLWIAGMVCNALFLLSVFSRNGFVPFMAMANMVWSLLSAFAVACIFLALGLVLKRVLMMIEHSKGERWT